MDGAVKDDGVGSLAPSSQRIVVLDIIRGLAVMGIVLANMPAFALPTPAYFSPAAWGGKGPLETLIWLINFTFVEGKMRGLFSLLFGASMLLIAERASASGESPGFVHFSRMAVLFGVGLGHFYLIWWGDILAHYALVGAIAVLFIRLSAAQLLWASLAALAWSAYANTGELMSLMASAGRQAPQAIAVWDNFAWHFGMPPREWVDSQIIAYRGSWSDRVAWNWQYGGSLISFLRSVGPETLAAMLLGMAGYRSGLLTGGWARKRYWQLAVIGLGLGLPAYLLLGIGTIAHDFDQRYVFFASVVATGPFRLMAVIGYAALIILLVQPSSRIGVRLAAVGRAAFTNYLGTSIIVTAIFYGWGLGQFAAWTRAEIYLIPPFVWAAMLVWSKPWLDSYRYGPLEWAWRTASRAELQPFRISSREHTQPH